MNRRAGFGDASLNLTGLGVRGEEVVDVISTWRNR